jgi:DNA repair protein RadA/Sms
MHGVDPGRVAMVLAVLERRTNVRLFNRDVYVSTVGGAKVTDPSADLAAAIAVASAALNRRLTQRFVAVGEVGLAGELRRVPGTDRRLAEAARLGFTEAIVPADSPQAADRLTTVRHGIRVHAAFTMAQALQLLDLTVRPDREAETIPFPAGGQQQA